jgi:hypothetical protein
MNPRSDGKNLVGSELATGSELVTGGFLVSFMPLPAVVLLNKALKPHNNSSLGTQCGSPLYPSTPPKNPIKLYSICKYLYSKSQACLKAKQMLFT